MNQENLPNSTQTATFGGGCFWCTEALFQKLKGVESVESGYAGGNKANPSYEEVSTGLSGHAEAIQIKFDPKIISYQKLLDIFWHTHNPTTVNQQGADKGSQYRSIIFYHDDEQHKVAEQSKQEFNQSGAYSSPIVTQIVPFTNFYVAEEYHQNYYQNNSDAPYCSVVIDPKLKKLVKEYSDDLK